MLFLDTLKQNPKSFAFSGQRKHCVAVRRGKRQVISRICNTSICQYHRYLRITKFINKPLYLDTEFDFSSSE